MNRVQNDSTRTLDEDEEELSVFYLGGIGFEASAAFEWLACGWVEAPAMPGAGDNAVFQLAFAEGKIFVGAEVVGDMELAVTVGDAEAAAPGAHGPEAAFFRELTGEDEAD